MNSKRRNLAILSGILLLVSPALGQSKPKATSAEQQATESAQKLMDEGAALYAKADWAGAHVAFLKAWEIVQHPAIATNLADVELRLGLYVQASERLRYLISTLPSDRKTELSSLEAQLAECRQHVTSLRIASDVADAIVTINGKEMGKVATIGELLVEPGQAAVVLSRPGYRDVQRNLYLAAGESRTLEFDLEPVGESPAPLPTVQAPPPPPHAPPEIQTKFEFGAREIVTLGGATLTVTAGFVGLLYWRQKQGSEAHSEKLRTGLGSDGCVPGEEKDLDACNDLRATNSRAHREAVITRDAFITAGALGVATVVTYLVWPSKKVAVTKASIAPWSTLGGGGVNISGRF
jgi:hypothetical protein